MNSTCGCRNAAASVSWPRAAYRERFVATMTHVMGEGEADIAFESIRTPVFLSPFMAVVFTDSTMTTEGHTQQLRYADVLIRRNGAWAFQTMLQSRWGDSL